MKINVTKNHIRGAKKFHCQECPVARAVIEAYGEEYKINVTAHNVYYKSPDGNMKFKHLPEDVTNRIMRFDSFCEDAMTPFSFEIDLD